MSQQDTASASEGLNCKTCGRFVKFQECKSDRNGNKGVLFAICHRVNEKGEHCDFIRRASKSPSASPTIPSQPTFAGPTVSTAPSVSGKCSVQACGQTRLAEDCPRRICRKHCIEQGGCTSKTHKSAATAPGPAATSSTAPLLAPPLSAPPPSATPQSPLYSHRPTPPQFDREASPNITATDARADPRFSTHLRPIFTEAIAEQQEKLRKANLVEAERKDMAQKSKQRIAIYPWTTETSPPTIKFFQDFTWPYLTINSSLLAAVGLLDASNRGDLRVYDEKEVFDWVAVDEGYVMEVYEGQRLFLKDACLRKCVDFEKCLDTHTRTSGGGAHHLYNQLARERAYVRKAQKMRSPSYSPPRSPSNSPPRSLSPEGAATTRQLLQQLGWAQPTPITVTPATQPTSPVQVTATLASMSALPPDPIDVNSDSDIEIVERHWPTDYFTVKIGQCLRECSSRTHRKHTAAVTQRSVFGRHFPGVRFIPSTFSNQRDLWGNASASLREEFMELGQCKEGLWSVFAKRCRQEQKEMADTLAHRKAN